MSQARRTLGVVENPNLIDWTRPAVKAVYDPMVGVLISRLNPAAQRLHGAGGDGGRDVQIKLGGRLEIYELKSFHGLLREGGRKAQISNSLANAAQHQPSAWYLVIPKQPTPDELTWFEELTAAYPFPCTWHGVDWLNSHMALMPDIPRYFLRDSAHEVLERLCELQQEQAAFNNGLPDALDRLRTLTARFNAEDPFYAFTFTTRPDGSIATTITPRYLGAERDCPLTISTRFQFPDTEDGRTAAAALEATFAYGMASSIAEEYVESVTVEGSALLAGTTGGAVSFGPASIDNIDRMCVRVRITAPDGALLAELPMIPSDGTHGLRGGVVHYSDHAGALILDLTLDAVGTRMNLHYDFSHPANCLPSSLLPTLRFLRHMGNPNRLELFAGGHPLGPPMEIPSQDGFAVRGAQELARMLAEIQNWTGVYFAIPESFTRLELESIKQAHALATEPAGITGAWEQCRLTLPAADLRSAEAEAFRGGIIPNLTSRGRLVLTLSDAAYDLGVVQTVFASARAIDWPDPTEDETPETRLTVTFVPADDDTVIRRLERPPGSDDPGSQVSDDQAPTFRFESR